MPFPYLFILCCTVIYGAASYIIPFTTFTDPFKLPPLNFVIAYNGWEELQNIKVKIKAMEIEKWLSS